MSKNLTQRWATSLGNLLKLLIKTFVWSKLLNKNLLFGWTDCFSRVAFENLKRTVKNTKSS